MHRLFFLFFRASFIVAPTPLFLLRFSFGSGLWYGFRLFLYGRIPLVASSVELVLLDIVGHLEIIDICHLSKWNGLLCCIHVILTHCTIFNEQKCVFDLLLDSWQELVRARHKERWVIHTVELSRQHSAQKFLGGAWNTCKLYGMLLPIFELLIFAYVFVSRSLSLN